mmetsp:Transcript_48900/g.157262  ORF Transcript_48900/g.157262 Transcript_48900/m.157262 type:complete len:426 (-) Transcript_48900:6-1283(-)
MKQLKRHNGSRGVCGARTCGHGSVIADDVRLQSTARELSECPQGSRPESISAAGADRRVEGDDVRLEGRTPPRHAVKKRQRALPFASRSASRDGCVERDDVCMQRPTLDLAQQRQGALPEPRGLASADRGVVTHDRRCGSSGGTGHESEELQCAIPALAFGTSSDGGVVADGAWRKTEIPHVTEQAQSALPELPPLARGERGVEADDIGRGEEGIRPVALHLREEDECESPLKSLLAGGDRSSETHHGWRRALAQQHGKQGHGQRPLATRATGADRRIDAHRVRLQRRIGNLAEETQGQLPLCALARGRDGGAEADDARGEASGDHLVEDGEGHGPLGALLAGAAEGRVAEGVRRRMPHAAEENQCLTPCLARSQRREGCGIVPQTWRRAPESSRCRRRPCHQPEGLCPTRCTRRGSAQDGLSQV